MWKITRNLILTITIIASAGFFFAGNVPYVEAQAQPGSPENPANQPSGTDPAPVKTESGTKVDVEAELGFTTTAALVYDALTGIGSWFTWVGGFLLDTSLSWFVWGMAETTLEFGLTDVIQTVWALIRDLFNLLFIFGLIFIGFQLILGIDDSASKRTLGTIIVAALLINFSLYVAQVVVDFGNIAAVEISKQFEVSAGSEVMGRPVFNIADSFIAATDLNNISSTTLTGVSELSSGVRDIPHQGIGVGQALVIGLTVAMMLIVLGFVFVAGAALMVMRYFYLIFLMMFSPVMVLGWILPQFKSRSSDWWKTLIKQSLLGPAYLFMLYISLLALQAFADEPSDQGITTFIMMSLIVSGFAWASLIVAQKIGAVGADQAMNMGQGMARRVRGGVTGFAGRNSLGRVGDWYNRRLEERGVSDKSWRRSIASTFSGNKFGGSYSRADARASAEKAEQKGARYDQLYGKKASPISKRTGGVVGAIATGSREGASEDDRIKMEQAITGMNNDQIIKMLQEHKPGSKEYAAVIANMSAGQYDAAMKAKVEELDDAAKAGLAENRKNAVTTSLGDLQENIKNASNHQLKVLGAKEIAQHAADLKQSQFDEIMKPTNTDYTETEKKNIKDSRETELIKRFRDNAESVFLGKKDGEIAKLPAEILMDDYAAEHITGNSMKKMMDDETVTAEQRKTIKEKLEQYGVNDSANEFLKTPQGKSF